MADDLTIKIGAKIKDYQDKMKIIKKETKDFEENLSKIAKRSAIAFAGFTAAITGTVISASKLEDVNTQFEVLTGSMETANMLMEELLLFSAETPFQFEGIAKTAQQLIGFGFEAGEVKDRLKEIGDVAAAIGKPIDEVGFIFGQVAAAGKLTGERLLQFQERAIPIGPAIAKTMGIAETAVRDAVSKGEVSLAIFEEAFASLSKEGGIAFDAMIKRSQTMSGVLSTLKDNFSLVSADIGKRFLPIVKEVALKITEFFKFIRANPAITDFIASFLAIGTAVSGVVASIAVALLVVVKITALLTAMGIAATIASTAFGILAGITGVGLVIAGISLLILKWNDIVDLWESTIPALKDRFFLLATTVSNVFGVIGRAIKAAFTGNFAAAKEELASFQTIMEEEQALFDEKQLEREERLKEERAARQKEEENKLKTHQDNKKKIVKKTETEATTTIWQELTKRQKFEDLTAKQKIQNFQSTAGQIATLSDSNNKALGAAGKAFAIADATINGIRAVQLAMSSAPPPFNFILAGLVGAAVAKNVAKIAGVQLAEGGVVLPTPGGTQATIGEGGKPEVVIPLDDERIDEFGLGRGGAGEPMRVEIAFTGDMARFIEEKQVENENLGISIKAAS